MKDLIVLTADRQQEQTLQTLLGERVQSLGIRPITFEVYPHPEQDSGTYHDADNFLRPFTEQFQHALVILDSEWDGAPPSETIESTLRLRLGQVGWPDNRAAVITITPELESWFWIDSSPHVTEILKTDWATIHQRGQDKGYWSRGTSKPERPKELLEDLIRLQRIPRSASLYVALAQKASWRRCQDRAFLQLVNTLQSWFPITG